ncbi:quinone-dependent dihydroorotate dehydrogenase [Aliiglaciecola sp. 3_MG-2023]|uniref:quinone-dependent dihydroorotate dehydrogenase n=1 Tax=Aliiglaciecola sp. 3_MG-2023 TaxID=3062644 RepID=UPI0026E1D392|nr:quinone-dependent dihydroorotate dehydrogenase [Aliiglaciecola sp. 3_MG-2023]MDO6692530.1 quinone-dependent dihydroorotate dehydrogenase [Aliiglaciecola sp. 3_MG-2023]
MYPIVQKALFQCDPEWSHDFTLDYLKRTQHNVLKLTYQQSVADHPVQCLGLTFKNPVGLAAGLDKNGECIDAFSAMGFGFIEVGTVTPLAQPGNDKPRMFRLPDAKSLINRMGFNNKGVDYLVEQVKQSQYDGILGINIGKNKLTEEQNALDDYLICLKKVYAYADYVTVNISSPNTPGLRSLQYGEALEHLLLGLKTEQTQLAQIHGKYVPLVVKIAPDLTDEEVKDIAESLVKTKIDGVIATNTTLDRSAVDGLRYAKEAGGLSGEVLTDKSLHITKKLAQYLDGAMPIIGVGGIHSSATANDRIEAGASLVQIYSSFIYQGPSLIKQIVKGLK